MKKIKMTACLICMAAFMFISNGCITKTDKKADKEAHETKKEDDVEETEKKSKKKKKSKKEDSEESKEEKKNSKTGKEKPGAGSGVRREKPKVVGRETESEAVTEESLSSNPVASTPYNKQMTTLYVVNCKENITLRNTPKTSGDEIVKIPLGAAVSFVESASNGFYKISYNGNTGYALASYLSEEPGRYDEYSNNDVVGTLYVVNCKESITLRTSPSKSAKEITQIPLGAAVGFINIASNGFYKISYNGNVGYALDAYLAESYGDTEGDEYDYGYDYDGPPIGEVVNCRESITLRAAPSTSAGEVLQIPLGAIVTVYEEYNDFYLIDYNGHEGYVLADYIYIYD